MTLTKKHFNAIAKILNEFKLTGECGCISDIADKFADYFAQENCNFDRQRFKEAVIKDIRADAQDDTI